MSDRGLKRLDNLELEFFHEQMVMLLDTGLPLPEGIRRFARDIRKPEFRQALDRLASGLDEGENFSEALAKDKRFFPLDYVALIKVGEQGGNLLKALSLAIEQERFQRNFRDRLKNTLIYPFLVFILVCATYSITIWFSYPVIFDSFQAAGIPIPWISGITYALFTKTGQYSPVLAALFLAMFFILRTRKVRLLIHAVFLKVPLLGKVLAERFIASFSEAMAILLKGGVSYPESFGLLAKVTANPSLASDLEKAAASAEQGVSFTDILSSMAIFPNLYIAAAASGEQSGILPDSLFNLAKLYRSETEFHSGLFLQTLDVVMILLLGIWVGGLLTAMYLMYFRFYEVIDCTLQW